MRTLSSWSKHDPNRDGYLNVNWALTSGDGFRPRRKAPVRRDRLGFPTAPEGERRAPRQLIPPQIGKLATSPTVVLKMRG